MGIVNFLGYPKELDGGGETRVTLRTVLVHLRTSLAECLRNSALRRLTLESMGFEGVFKAVKDYLQPVLAAAALGLGTRLAPAAGLSGQQKAALLVGPVYFVLFLLAAAASRNAHRLLGAAPADCAPTDVRREQRLAGYLWVLFFLTFLVLLPTMYFEVHALVIAGFVFLHVLQNLWRPALISRYDAHSCETRGATILSVESQSKSLATMALAPLVGWCVDTVSAHGPGGALWPVAGVGLGVAALLFCASRVFSRNA
jgi:hypothetical protein